MPELDVIPGENARSAEPVGAAPGDGTVLARESFRWESQMTSLVEARMSKLLPRGGAVGLVAAEVPAARGIADLVSARFDSYEVGRRLELGIGPICSPPRIRALSLLRQDRGMRLRTLSRKVGMSEAGIVRSVLEPLVSVGAVEVTSNLVRSTGAWRPVGEHLTAVELKLSKWESALRQADQFSRSADRVWVVLDAWSGRAAERHAHLFREVGVGLAFLSTDGSLRLAVPPGRRQPVPWLRALMAERVWAAGEAEVSRSASRAR